MSSMITPGMLARGQRAASDSLTLRYDHLTQQGSTGHPADGGALRLQLAELVMTSPNVGGDGPPVTPDGDGG